MVRMAGDPDLRRRMAAAGRARVRDAFGIDRMVDETLAVYRDTGSGGSPTPS